MYIILSLNSTRVRTLKKRIKQKTKKFPRILLAGQHIMIFSIIDMKSYEFEEPYSMNNYSWLNLLSIQLFKTAFSPFSQEQELIFIFGLIGSKMNWLPLSQSSPRPGARSPQPAVALWRKFGQSCQKVPTFGFFF